MPNLAGGQSGYYLLTVEHPDLKLTAARYPDVQHCLGLPEAPATAFSLFPNPTPSRSTPVVIFSRLSPTLCYL